MRRGILILAMVLGPALAVKAQTTCSGSIVPNASCEVIPPFTPNFDPVIKWEWPASVGGFPSEFPEHVQVMMTPLVADLDGDGVPEVIFSSFRGRDFQIDGVVRVISGLDGTKDPGFVIPTQQVRGAAAMAVGNIDNDPELEILAIPEFENGVLCFEHTGTLKWQSNVPIGMDWGGVSLADLDGDGTPEIIAGNVVLNADGTVRWTAGGPLGGSRFGPISFAADINADGVLEVINGPRAYTNTGLDFWTPPPGIGDGSAAVADFDNDGLGEVVVVWRFNNVSLLDVNGLVLSTVTLPGASATGGPPTIADFDNDGRPEIGVAGANVYAVFDVSGSPPTINSTPLWTATVQDFSSNVTGSSVFDFEGDGSAEVVYNDERFLRIYDGATGVVRFEVPNCSGTAYENPVLVDVDGDGNAEIVVCANNYSRVDVCPDNFGIRVFRDRNDGWVNTRAIWNQHAYSITNVNDDGSIPTYIQPNWLGGGPPDDPRPNTFRANSQGSADFPVFAAPDLTALSIEGACDASGDFVLTAMIGNNATVAGLVPGVAVAFYDGDPQAGGTLITPALGFTNPMITTQSVPPLGSIVVSLTASLPNGMTTVFVCVDDDGTGTGSVAECDETNNCCSAVFTVSCRCAFPPAQMISWWPLDEPTGTKAADIVRGNDGTHVGPLVRSIEKVNGSLFFNGIDTHVEVPDPADGSLDFGASTGNGAGDFSIDAWIQRQPPNGVIAPIQPIVEKFGSCLGSDFLGSPPGGDVANVLCLPVAGYSFQTRDDQLVLGLGECFCQPLTFFFSDPIPQLKDGQWHHVAVTVDRDVSVNGITFYFDGQPVPGANLDPTVESGTLENNAALLIGTGFSNPIGFFHGGIDEVEIFGRVVDPGEIAGIFLADNDGKCKDRSRVPAVKTLCLSSDSVIVQLTICNDSTEGHTYQVAPNGLAAGADCTVDGPAPADFTFLDGVDPNQVQVDGGTCKTIRLEITPGLTPGSGDSACYEVVITNLDTGHVFRSAGKIRTPLTCEVCIGMSCADVGQVGSLPIAVTPCLVFPPVCFGVPVGFPVGNVGFSAGVLDYEITVQAYSGVSVNEVVSLDGLAPGTNVIGSLALGPGESQTIPVNVAFLAYDPFRFYDILLLVDTDGDGVKEPIDAIGAWSVLPPSCPEAADFDSDNDVDAADFAVFQASFGHSEGDPAYNAAADYDGDGTVSLLDYQVWLECYRQFIGNPTAPPPTPTPGDFDFDGDVDSNDFLTFSNCFNGTLNPPTPSCANVNADMDGDGDVDPNDFLTFSNCFNGSTNPPACP